MTTDGFWASLQRALDANPDLDAVIGLDRGAVEMILAEREAMQTRIASEGLVGHEARRAAAALLLAHLRETRQVGGQDVFSGAEPDLDAAITATTIGANLTRVHAQTLLITALGYLAGERH